MSENHPPLPKRPGEDLREEIRHTGRGKRLVMFERPNMANAGEDTEIKCNVNHLIRDPDAGDRKL